MIQILQQTAGNLIAIKATGKLTVGAYAKLLPLLVDRFRQFKTIRWYFEMEDFKGWDAKALWEDIKFDVTHANGFEKIAMVGEKPWQEKVTDLMKPFTKAEVKFFKLTEKDAALSWIGLNGS
ncbi:SpoIIAA-like [Cnuella takakiae]|uniref:SpoIIAA-like n=1 Tax=Cnuella takakiae TaxID=1302690 RepID=A0A1M5HSF9_9BACT|nr:STAS/SEC14 domain-containing protein [Cnuella takakiae]OLY95659.1 STAS/SEC14 domain-containing protein [Cnuella takakiae]SHG18914.1 SpoIIAA-like [Cnuella takakiae]